MTDLTALLAKLEAWTPETASFHGDRQLADEVLIATGWSCHPDPQFEGGVRWDFGTNPTVCTSENSRPHPIQSVDHALGQIPFRWALHFLGDRVDWDLSVNRWHITGAKAEITQMSHDQLPASCSGISAERPVAICIAIVRALIAGAKP